MSHLQANASHPLDLPGFAVAVFCCALWGGNTVAVKFVDPDVPPLACAMARFLLAAPFIGLVCLRARSPLWVARPYWGLLGIHALLAACQIMTFNWGTAHSLAGRSSVFINIHPLIAAPLAWIVLHERMGIRGWVGLGSASFGIAVLLIEPLRTGGGWVGDLVVILAGIVFAIQTVAQKMTFPYIPPTTLLFNQSMLAVPICLMVSLVSEDWSSAQLSHSAIGGLLYMGVVVSFLCFTLWFLLLRRHPASQLAPLAFLTPLFGVGLGKLVLGEELTWELIIGGGLVGTGIYLSSTSSMRARMTDQAERSQEPNESVVPAIDGDRNVEPVLGVEAVPIRSDHDEVRTR